LVQSRATFPCRIL